MKLRQIARSVGNLIDLLEHRTSAQTPEEILPRARIQARLIRQKLAVLQSDSPVIESEEQEHVELRAADA